MPTLDDLKPGTKAIVEELEGDDLFAQRLMEMGLLEGTTVEFIRRAPLGDPIEVRVNNRYQLSLRREDARRIRLQE
ncbi:MAG: ferrous iron transport protein [Candidatus Sumerlaeota bacterium]|nr:ferrous iron transport protein [Candidatus Sumerlaeota bacterium]